MENRLTANTVTKSKCQQLHVQQQASNALSSKTTRKNSNRGMSPIRQQPDPYGLNEPDPFGF